MDTDIGKMFENNYFIGGIANDCSGTFCIYFNHCLSITFLLARWWSLTNTCDILQFVFEVVIFGINKQVFIITMNVVFILFIILCQMIITGCTHSYKHYYIEHRFIIIFFIYYLIYLVMLNWCHFFLMKELLYSYPTIIIDKIYSKINYFLIIKKCFWNKYYKLCVDRL